MCLNLPPSFGYPCRPCLGSWTALPRYLELELPLPLAEPATCPTEDDLLKALLLSLVGMSGLRDSSLNMTGEMVVHRCPRKSSCRASGFKVRETRSCPGQGVASSFCKGNNMSMLNILSSRRKRDQAVPLLPWCERKMKIV